METEDQDAQSDGNRRPSSSKASAEREVRLIGLVWDREGRGRAVRRRCPGSPHALAVVLLMATAGLATAQDAEIPMPRALRFAHELFRQRKYDLAADEYARFLETDPKPPHGDDARFGLASAELLQGHYREARDAFREFLRRAPDHARARTAWYRLGELSYMLGDLPSAREALERFTAAPEEHPNLETAWTYLGDVRSALDEPKAARSAYEQALKSFPNARLADRARYGLGRALAAVGEPEAALDVLNDLIRRNPPEWVDKARLQVGKIELAAGRYEVAEKALGDVGGSGPLRSEAQLRRAQALLKLDRLDEAADLLRPLAADPADATSLEASLDLASTDLRRDQAEAALKTLDDAIPRAEKSPLQPALLFRSAEALRALKRLPDARERFLKVAETAPSGPWADDAWLEAARLALQAGDETGAEKLAQDFAAKFPESKLHADVLLVQAKSAVADARPADAIPALEAILGQGAKPLSPSPEVVDAARYELAQAYRAVGKAEQADAMLAELAKSSRKGAGADAAFLLGRSHLDAGRFAEAEAAFAQYLDAAPDGPIADHAMANRAAALLSLNRREDAAEAVDRLATRFPKSPALPPAQLRLAEALVNAGELPRAVERFRSLADSTDPNIHDRAELGLARSLAKQGDAASAAKAFDALLARTTDETKTADLLLEKARAVEASGKLDEALAAYEQVETRAPKQDAALFAALARSRLLAKDKPGEAAALLGKLLDGDAARERLKAIGQPVDALLAERGWDLVDDGKLDEADKVFAGLLADFPNGPYAADARFNLAESANARKDFAEVEKLLAPLVDATGPEAPKLPERLAADVLYRLGRTRVERAEWPQAAATLDRLIAETPANPRIREAKYLRAEAALRQDQFEAAEKTLADLIAAPAAPDDPPDLLKLAKERRIECLLGLKRWQPALDEADALKGSITVPAERDPVEFARGRALLGLGRPDDARTAFQAVIDARRQQGDLAAQAQLMIGETFFHEEKFLQALREFLRVDINYDSPRRRAAALLEAGKVYERMGRWSEAAETYERLAKDFSDDPHAAEAKARRDKVLAEHPSGKK